jgi:hypothetical protein
MCEHALSTLAQTDFYKTQYKHYAIGGAIFISENK